MKKQILFIFFAGFLIPAFSQNLRNEISGNNGVSKHFTVFTSGDQNIFNPKDVNHVFDFTGNESLILMRAETDALGNINYRYIQTYMNIPVENAMYIIRTKAGKMVGASGEIVTSFDAQMANRKNIKINAKDAVAIGLQYIHAQSYMWQDARAEEILKEQMKDKNATYYPTANLVWYNSGENLDPSKLVLAYKVDIYATEPMSRAYYFIDAQSGKILGQKEILHTVDAVGTANTLYSGTQTIHSDFFNGSYRLRDYSRGNGVTTYDWANNKSDITSPSANFNLSGLSQNGLDAHWGVEMTYDFYLANFNRNSLDNNGILLNSYVNRGGFLYNNNASWDGTNMNYGKRSGTTNGVTAIDVTGHELSHGFTQYTSGLNYSGESGGMNESISDIMGKSVQFWAKPNDKNWVLSNDMNWAIRDMSNPNAFSQPDCYGGLYWKSNADVHILSGVGNFMFYLLVDGGAGTNDIGNTYSVQSIGLSKADQIIYRTNTTYLVPNSKYSDWRTASINAATDLYGANSNEVIQVKNAWYAVGIGTAGGGNNYCTSNGNSTNHGYIQRVRMSKTTLNNGSGNDNGYGDFTSITTNVSKGINYILYLKPAFDGQKYTTGWTVYIDYNGDKDFNDAGELVGSKSYSASTTVDTIQFSIPSTALNGSTRMRIQMHAGNIITDPCASFEYGEVEDYTLIITGSGLVNSFATHTEESANNIIVSPNPVVGSSANVRFGLQQDGNVILKLYDIKGRAVSVQNAGAMFKGDHSITLSELNKLPAGNYKLVVEQNNQMIYKTSLIIVK